MEVVRIEGLNCNDNSVITIVKNHSQYYSLLFWNAYFFTYHSMGNIGNGLKCQNDRILENTIRYFDVKISIRYARQFENPIEYITDMLAKKREVIIQLDQYYCSWSDAYYQKHTYHVLIPIEKEKEKLKCMDTMPVKVQRISFFDLQKSLYRIITVDGDYSVDFVWWEKYGLKKAYRWTSTKNHIWQMKKFLRDITALKTIEHEMLIGEPIWKQPIYRQIASVYGGRYQFLMYLRLFDEDESKLIQTFQDITNRWNAIRIWFYRICLNPKEADCKWKEYKGLITQNLEIVISLEKEVKKLLRDEIGKSKRRHADKGVIQKLVCIDIEHNGFSHLLSNMQNHNVLFCKGNLLRCKGYVKNVHLYGYAKWGSQISDITIVRDDGKKIAKQFTMSDWSEEVCVGESIVYKTKVINEGKECDAKVCDVSIAINESIISMQLPNNENICLFAVAVMKMGGDYNIY